MIVLLGVTGSAAESAYANPNISAELNAYGEAWLDTLSEAFPSPGVSSMLSVAPLVPFRVLSSASLGRSYFDDFYNRIIVSPSSLDAGNLVSNQQLNIDVWNAFVTPQTLSAVDLVNGTGLEIVMPSGITVPYEIEALRELTFGVLLRLAGPPSINAVFVLTIEGVDYEVPITGRRVVLFPFAPNWSTPFDETWVHRSWVIKSEDGDEQTGSQYGDRPRRTFEYTVALLDEIEVQRFENMMFSWQARFFGVPHWAEKSYLDDAIAPGGLTAEFDTAGMTLNPGGLLTFYKNNELYEVREIASIVGDVVTLTTGLDNAWPAGTVVMPCFIALAGGEVSGSYDTSRVARVPMTFECEPSQTYGNTDSAPAVLTYRGYELYLGKINWASALTFNFTSDRRKLDENTGKVAASSTSGFSVHKRQHNWTIYDKAAAMAFRQFIGRREGVTHPVFMPSGKPDFMLAQEVFDNDGYVVVTPNEYNELVSAHPARRDLIILLVDGTYVCRRITSATATVDGTRLDLDAIIPVGFAAEDVLRISYLTLFRFESPSISIRWLTDNKGTVQQTMVAKKTED